MNRILFLAAALLTLSSTVTQGAQTAHARLFCWSLRFQGASANDSYGFQWRVDMTTIGSGDNGELAQDFFDSGYSHSTFIDLYSELYDETDPGVMVVDVPNGGDANGNGFGDFWEVSQTVSGLTTSGVIQCPNLAINYNLTAQWYRDTGSAMGTCVITFPDPANPFNEITFYHSFELIEYSGPLTYTPGSNSVSGSVDLVQTGTPTNTLKGELDFVKSLAEPFNNLALPSVFLTNAAMQTLDLYATNIVIRDTTYPTNYYGDVEFNDGDPNTGEDDYYNWELSIDDLNDTDGDGIPDFSDDPKTTVPARPMLILARDTTNLLLTISGDPGTDCDILEADSVTSTNWSNVLSLTLTNGLQTVPIPLPGVTTFWRVLAH